MNKKKILSILMISLIVLGTVLFVVKSLQAGNSDLCSQQLATCSDDCLQYADDLSACIHNCTISFYHCLEK